MAWISAFSKSRQRGQALVEFALIALIFFLILAAILDLGRMVFMSQAAQDAARIAARELALMPLPADMTLAQALQDPTVQQQIFDERLLVIDSTGMAQADLDKCLAELPVVNKALFPVMITDLVTVGGTDHTFLRYPGALLQGDAAPSIGVYKDCKADQGFLVGIPEVIDRPAGKGEKIRWVPILSEILQNPADANSAPFKLTPAINPATGTPYLQSGLAAIRINLPFQAAMLTGFRSTAPTAEDPLPPNINNSIVADDSTVDDTTNAPPNGGATLGLDQPSGVYAGPYGLGRQFALLKTVRPYRKLLAAQAIFRREVFE